MDERGLMAGEPSKQRRACAKAEYVTYRLQTGKETEMKEKEQ